MLHLKFVQSHTYLPVGYTSKLYCFGDNGWGNFLVGMNSKVIVWCPTDKPVNSYPPSPLTKRLIIKCIQR